MEEVTEVQMETPVCPLKFSNLQSNSCLCEQGNCAWWVIDTCAISDICRTLWIIKDDLSWIATKSP